jgi:transaldolase
MTILDQLAMLGQSIWLDYIDRTILFDGELQKLIDAGLRGMTSNPSIFEKAISQGGHYDQAIRHLFGTGLTAEEITVQITVDDVRKAAELLHPVYQDSRGLDGYISLEVNPRLAFDAQGTLAEAKRLWALVNKPNLMVKIPATRQALPAISGAIAAGINVNVTLIFSLERYTQVIQAYISGLAERVQKGEPVEQIASVASFFVSRIDTKVDFELERLAGQPENNSRAAGLLGKSAIASAKLAYQQYKRVFEGPEFSSLKDHGAQVQRPLWASTSTKNPAYSDILYVQELIGPQTVNTLPKETLTAFMDHGQARLSLEDGVDQAAQVFNDIHHLGIDLNLVTGELESEGVQAFEKSYNQLVESIQAKSR